MPMFMKDMFRAVCVTWQTFPINWERNKASEYFDRMKEHLKENGLKLEETDYVVGRTLEFDSKTESIKGDDEANKLLTRDYRAPYVVPEKV